MGTVAEVLVPILVLATLIELATTVFRVSFHMQSAKVQRRLHWPRIHHSYPGIAFMVSYWFFPEPWLLIVGGALVLSDVFHHLVAVPALHGMHYDVCMSHHERAHKVLQRVSGVVLLITGLVALMTPLAPGSFLVIIGLFLLCGRSLTRTVLLSVLTKERYRKLKIEKIFEKFKIL